MSNTNGSIIISGLPAVGKSTIAKKLAKLYKMKYVDGGNIIKRYGCELLNIKYDDSDDWWESDSGMKLLAKRKQDQSIDTKIDEKLRDMCNTQNIVITSYTLPWLTNTGTKIWLDCNTHTLIDRLSKRDNITFRKATKLFDKRLHENYKLYKKLYNIEYGIDKKPFDYIIDTTNKDINDIIQLVSSKIR